MAVSVTAATYCGDVAGEPAAQRPGRKGLRKWRPHSPGSSPDGRAEPVRLPWPVQFCPMVSPTRLNRVPQPYITVTRLGAA
eukprot:766344-Hanusia_phi.AAC.4